MSGSTVGFCPNCRSKVLQPRYAKRLPNGTAIHIAKKKIGWHRNAPVVVCEGEIIECDYDKAHRLQALAGFPDGKNRAGRAPYIDDGTDALREDYEQAMSEHFDEVPEDFEFHGDPQ